MAVVSCFLLVVCGLLSKPAISAMQSAYTQGKTAQSVTKRLDVRQDPTRPPSVMVQQLAPEISVKPEYELTAIFTRNNNQYAVVNGNVVKAGDPVADMLVTEISSSNLTMKQASSSQRKTLNDVLVLELSGTVNIKKQVKK